MVTLFPNVDAKINGPDRKKQYPTALMARPRQLTAHYNHLEVTRATWIEISGGSHRHTSKLSVTWARGKRPYIKQKRKEGRREERIGDREILEGREENGVVGDRSGNCLFLRAQTNLQARSQDSASSRQP